MNAIAIFVTIVLGIIVGVIVGVATAFFVKKFSAKRDQKNIQDFLEGKKENNYKLDDGKIVAVDTFKLQGENSKEQIISVKGGLEIKDVSDENKKNRGKKRSLNHPLFEKR